MSFIAKYYNERNKSLKNYTGDQNRNFLGEREIDTFQTLHKISYGESINLASKRVLDLGAGDLFLSKPLKNLGATYLHLDIEQINFNTDIFPIESNSVNVVFMLALIEHIQDIEHFFAETLRVLVEDGIIYIITPNFKYCYRDFYNDPTHIRPFTENSLKELAQLYSLKEINTYPALRCKPSYMYTRRKSFAKAAKIPFLKNRTYLPSFLTGRATSVALIAKK